MENRIIGLLMSLKQTTNIIIDGLEDDSIVIPGKIFYKVQSAKEF